MFIRAVKYLDNDSKLEEFLENKFDRKAERFLKKLEKDENAVMSSSDDYGNTRSLSKFSNIKLVNAVKNVFIDPYLNMPELEYNYFIAKDKKYKTLKYKVKETTIDQEINEIKLLQLFKPHKSFEHVSIIDMSCTYFKLGWTDHCLKYHWNKVIKEEKLTSLEDKIVLKESYKLTRIPMPIKTKEKQPTTLNHVCKKKKADQFKRKNINVCDYRAFKLIEVVDMGNIVLIDNPIIIESYDEKISKIKVIKKPKIPDVKPKVVSNKKEVPSKPIVTKKEPVKPVITKKEEPAKLISNKKEQPSQPAGRGKKPPLKKLGPPTDVPPVIVQPKPKKVIPEVVTVVKPPIVYAPIVRTPVVKPPVKAVVTPVRKITKSEINAIQHTSLLTRYKKNLEKITYDEYVRLMELVKEYDTISVLDETIENRKRINEIHFIVMEIMKKYVIS